MKKNGMDNAQHCRLNGELRRLEPETTEPDGDEEKVQVPRGWPDSFVVLSYTCSDRAEQSIIIIVVSEPMDGSVS